jgi:restriction system protein
MSIPDFESIMRPLLNHLSDERDYGTDETLDVLAQIFKLTEDERRQLLPSGRQALFRNRVAWAKFHLKKALVVETSRRGVYRITERGKELLRNVPERIDMSILKQFPEYRAFLLNSRRNEDVGRGSSEGAQTVLGQGILGHSNDTQDRYTPEELMGLGYSRLNGQLSTELLDRIKAASPEFFEQVVLELLLSLGYGGSRLDAGQVVGRSGDEGIDGLIKEDRLGLDTIYIQAKRWENVVGRPDIQKFAGALQGQRAKKGIFITTSSFSREAQAFASSIESKIVLIDGDQLARLMIENSVGVTRVAAYEIKRIDSDYFTEE